MIILKLLCLFTILIGAFSTYLILVTIAGMIVNPDDWFRRKEKNHE